MIDDRTGRALVLGDAGTADQDDLCAVYGDALAADLVVTPPGGAVSPVLLATSAAIGACGAACPGCSRRRRARTGTTTHRTGVDGDLDYTGGSSGLAETR